MISLNDLTVEYPYSRPLDRLTSTIDSSPAVVMGPSGSGKSTLLRVIAGLQRPTSGSVRIDGAPVSYVSWRRAADIRVALIHQDLRLVAFLSVEENLRLAAEMRGIRLDVDDIAWALDRVGLGGEFAARDPRTLSGGEQQRVAIARALACRVEVLLADEPTGALDAVNTERVARVFVELGQGPKVTVLVATHDPVVASMIDTRYVIEDGQLAAA